MESIENVRAQILARLQPLKTEWIPLQDAGQRWLAEDVFTQDPIPPFDNSSMDGFGIRSQDTAQASPQNPVTLKVIGQVEAGAEMLPKLASGQAVRIYTGAPIPPDLDAVVPWEKTASFDQDSVQLDQAVVSGYSIRRKAEDIAKGELAMGAGTRLSPAAIGMLASVGCALVPVGPKLRVAIHSTGNELVNIEATLGSGKIRNSNLYSIAARIESFGATALRRPVLLDTPEAVREGLKHSLRLRPDAIITTGGVSAGDLDFVREVAQEFGGDIAVRKVRMKPGKPLVDGLLAGIPFFGLPGNPAACLVSFESFVRPALAKLEGRNDGLAPKRTAYITQGHPPKQGDRIQYLRGFYRFDLEKNRYQVEIQSRQGSHQMRSFAQANCLVEIPPSNSEDSPAEEAPVTILLLD